MIELKFKLLKNIAYKEQCLQNTIVVIFGWLLLVDVLLSCFSMSLLKYNTKSQPSPQSMNNIPHSNANMFCFIIYICSKQK